MKRTMAYQSKARRGLTLLELMIVLIILVGLMAIVGPRLLGSQKKADIKTAMAQIGNLESALKQYYVDMKTFPTTEEGLESLLSAPEDEDVAKNWAGPYLDGKKLPIDPWNHEFVYEFGSEEGSEADDTPTIYSLGPDGKANTDDDIRNQGSSKDGEEDGQSSGKRTKV
jgi:general secretion pathway protein G